MPARSGDCTSARKRASASAGSVARAVAPAVARRALKVKSSISALTLSVRDAGYVRRGGLAVVVGLIALDQPLHLHSIALPMPMAGNGMRAAARFDDDAGEEQARVDFHRRDMGHVNRFFDLADPLRRVLNDARRCDEHLGWKQPVPRPETA